MTSYLELAREALTRNATESVGVKSVLSVITPDSVTEAEVTEDFLRNGSLDDGTLDDLDLDDWWFSQMHDEDLDWLRRPKVKPDRCVWCWRILPDHTDFCREMHERWSVVLKFARYKGKTVHAVAQTDK